MRLFKLTLPDIEHTSVTEDGDTLTLRNKTTNAVYAEASNDEIKGLLATGHFYDRVIRHAYAHKVFYLKAKSIEDQHPKVQA